MVGNSFSCRPRMLYLGMAKPNYHKKPEQSHWGLNAVNPLLEQAQRQRLQ